MKHQHQSVSQSVSACISFQQLTLNCVTIQSENILFNYIAVFVLFSYSNLFLNTLILASAESPMPNVYRIQAVGLIPEWTVVNVSVTVKQTPGK